MSAGPAQGDDDGGQDEGGAASFAPGELLVKDHDPGQYRDDG